MTSINLSELNYTSIRNSLVNYLKTQDAVKDLNFQGSAVNFLLDLLAYNTLYYAHFANMISSESFLESAQLERSIVSLVKPLGYTVPTKTSSIARIKVRGITSVTTVLPYQLSIEGTTPSGVRYQFWNVDDVLVRPFAGSGGTETDYFSAYEGTYNELSYGGDGFDYPNQEIFIPDLNLDIKTIKVSVKRVGEKTDYTYWKRLDVYSGLFIEPTSNLFSIERTQSGFKIKFANTVSSEPNLKAGDLLNIKYLSSNGSNGNNCSSFKSVVTPGNNPITIVSLASSFGGLDSPNLNEVKRVAPLIFSAQQRLVTKSDYYAFLSQLGYVNGVNVWGGEENSPPIYGRVLFSIAGIGTNDNSEIADVITKLKDRSIVTILPEYIPPTSMTVNLNLLVTYRSSEIQVQPESALLGIKNSINSNFPVGAFNTNYTRNISEDAVNLYAGYNYDSNSSISLSYSVSPSSKSITLNFKNRIRKNSPSGNTINSSNFQSPYYSGTVRIQDVPIIFSDASTNPPSIGKLKLFSYSSTDGSYTEIDNSNVGDVNYATGVVTLQPGFFNTTIQINAAPDDRNNIIAKDQVYLTMNINATATAE